MYKDMYGRVTDITEAGMNTPLGVKVTPDGHMRIAVEIDTGGMADDEAERAAISATHSSRFTNRK